MGNLSFSTTAEQVREQFAAYGAVESVDLPTDRETGQPRGFCFVTMADSQSVNNAINGLNGVMVDGRSWKVNEAQERSPRTGGRGGYTPRPRG
ncbi:MAG: RNA-binding protein [Ardenticatenaceae bacterium]|nr:RNA-binding protein [Ardenticatenaceae bacterium]